MYDLAVNRTISLSGHLSNIDEINQFLVYLLEWLTILTKKCQFSILMLAGGMAGLNNGYCPICQIL